LKKDRQYNGQNKKDKGTNNDLQNTKQKTKDRVTRAKQYFIRNDAHIQNTLQNLGIQKQEDLYKSISLIQNIGIQKQEDLYKSVSLIQIRKIKQVLK
jgi:hypothetical protein